jgi:HK97 family phage major capsid protein
MSKIIQLQKEKRELWYKAQELQKLVEGEQRLITADEQKVFNDLIAKMDEYQRQIDVLEKMGEVERELQQPVFNQRGEQVSTVLDQNVRYSKTLEKWMRKGMGALSQEERLILQPNAKDGKSEAVELRTPGALVNPTYAQTTDVVQALEEAKKYYFGWEDAVTVIRTGKGNQLNYPTVDDTSYTGAKEAVGTDAFDSSDAITLGYKQLNAYIYSSQGLAVADDDLEDGDFDMGAMIGQVLGTRLWRAIATAAMTGTGSSLPQGLARAAAKGLLTGNCTITYARMIQFNKTLDWAYLTGPKSGYMFHQSMYWDIMGLQSTTGQPLWQPSMAVGAPATFMGMRYWISNELTASTTVSALSRHMIYGDFSKFVIRYAGPTTLVRLNERYKEVLKTGFIALQRFDSELIAANATTYNPVKYLRRMGT